MDRFEASHRRVKQRELEGTRQLARDVIGLLKFLLVVMVLLAIVGLIVGPS